MLEEEKRKRKKKRKKKPEKKSGGKPIEDQDNPDDFEQDDEKYGEFRQENENLVALSGADLEEIETTYTVDRNLVPDGATRIKSWFVPTQSYSVKIAVLQENIKTEQVSYTLEGEEKVLTACKEKSGPSGSQITWEAIARLMVLAVNFSMPIFRIAKLLGGAASIFSTPNICRWFKDAANKFVYIYIHLGELIAELTMINADDSKTRCLGMEKTACDPDHQSTEELIAKTEEVFGRQFDKKNGGGKKRSLMISHLTGKVSYCEQLFRIHFFRTHFGCVGNLLDKLLEMRSPKNRTLNFQSDLSSQNLPSLKFREIFKIIFSGCAAHARRPFWRYRDHDEELTDYFLKGFFLLSWVEKRAKDLASLLHQRQKYGVEIWKCLYERALEVVEFRPRNNRIWPKGSKIYGACLYIVKNYQKLTEYLNDAELSFTNNLCERMLRAEKMLLVSCKFRKSESGRVVFDIFRTIIMTANANEVELIPYLTWVLSQESEAIKQNPEAFTPWAYKLQKSGCAPSAEAA